MSVGADRCDHLFGGGQLESLSAVAWLGEELFELVDDQQDALTAGLGREPPAHRCRDPLGARPGQPGTLDLGEHVLSGPGEHGQPSVAARQLPSGQRTQHTRLDQRRLARPRRPEELRQPPLLGEVGHDLPYRFLTSLEPPGVLGGERLQPSVRADLVLGQLRMDPPQGLCRSYVGDALTSRVLVGGGDLGEHADDQAGHLVQDGSAAEPGGEVASGGQLKMRTPAVRARQHIAGHAEAEVSFRRGLGGESERAHLMAPASLRGAQRQRPHTRRCTAQPDEGHVLVLGGTPQVGQDVPLHQARTLHLREGQQDRLAGPGRGRCDDVRTGDNNCFGHQEARPRHCPVRP